MSFQGDVAGLGLGELLQGLARGGREGILTLRGGGLAARLGVQDGQLHLLPDEDEDSEVWRKRCERAWVKDPDERVDSLRMGEIAHASRMETMFALLDSEGVHFRFEPGPLPAVGAAPPQPPADPRLGVMETGAPSELKLPVRSAPISVEFLLLEYARLIDELAGHPGATDVDDDAVPRTLGENAPHKSFTRVWSECDGMSNVREIADRLGWPIRQVRGLLQDLVQRTALRFADERELLALAQRELQAGRLTRAAARLACWVRSAPAGAPNPGDAQLLLAEWEKGKLAAALASMPACDTRTFLRRLDLAHDDPSAAIARWNEIRKHHKHDPICELRALHWQHKSANEADAPSMTDLLRVARKFQEMGHPWRAGIVLRAAGSRGPESTSIRLEIGQRMVMVGLTGEGARWIVEACRVLLAAGTPDRAIAPLRHLLSAAPSHREAKALLALAHGRTVTGKRTRRNSLVALASALLVSIGAVVKVRHDQDVELRISEVTESIAQPELALRMLQERFGASEADSVRALRQQLESAIREREAQVRSDWTQRFIACQLECAGGDPVLGLRDALALPPPPPPRAESGDEAPPRMSSLLDGLAARLEQTLAEWGAPDDSQPEAVHAEQRLARLIEDLGSVVANAPRTGELTEFGARLDALAATLRARDEVRAAERERNLRAQSIEQQDMLLAAARAHTSAGDLARAVDAYDKLAQVAGSEPLIALLAPDIADVRAHLEAVIAARALAAAGQHAEALTTLSAACRNLREHLLPCRIDSLPHGARVHMGDEGSRVTPFTLELAPGERMALRLELEGYESAQLVLDSPADQLVLLSRMPGAWWPTSARVEALPVRVDEGYIVCDRDGQLARLGAGGALVWTRKLDSLSGIARAPVFLPKRPGSLLVVTEEGAVWIVDANDGRFEGPWRTDVAPMRGPDPSGNGVVATFRDGREMSWTARLRPETETLLDARALSAPTRGHDAGLAVLRRGAIGGQTLRSPWGDWVCEVATTEFVVRRDGEAESSFAARRQGEWTFIAWEAPQTRLPHGRLWVSDAAGLRAFEP